MWSANFQNMINIIEIVFAIRFIAELITQEDVFSGTRTRLVLYFQSKSEEIGRFYWLWTKLAYVFQCKKCMSIYVMPIVFMIFFYCKIILLPLAIIGLLWTLWAYER